MKKRLKKILAVAVLLSLIFTFTVKPKKADAIGVELTIAGLVASGMALPAALIAIAGAAAIGGLIGTNMDGIKQFGSDVWIDLTNKGVDPNGLVDTENKTVTMSPDLINSAARTADTSAVNTQRISNNYQQIATTDKPFRNWQSYYTNIEPIAIATGMSVVFWTYTSHNISLTNNYLYLKDSTGANNQLAASYTDGHYTKYESAESFYGKTITAVSTFLYNGSTYYDATDTPSVYKAEIYTTSNALPVENISSPSVFTEADNVYQRQLYANSLLAQNQVMQLDENMDYANSTLEDVLSSSNANYDESKTQTGILTNMWNIIKGIPSSIAAAGVAASAAINTKMTDLWEDAGAIWTGMADTLTNIKTDVNAKIGSLSDAMAGGIDNIRTDIGTMMENLRAGIDSMAASAAANMASWGQLTLDGIDAGIGAITSGLTNAWTKTTTAIDTAVTATTTAITNLTDKLTTGMDQIITFITDIPAMMMSIVIPPASEFSMAEKIAEIAQLLEQKFGSLDNLMTEIRGAFDQTGSIYEIEISLMGRQYKIVPIMLKPTIDGARPFLTAAVNLTSLTFLIHRNKKELFK